MVGTACVHSVSWGLHMHSHMSYVQQLLLSPTRQKSKLLAWKRWLYADYMEWWITVSGQHNFLKNCVLVTMKDDKLKSRKCFLIVHQFQHSHVRCCCGYFTFIWLKDWQVGDLRFTNSQFSLIWFKQSSNLGLYPQE